MILTTVRKDHVADIGLVQREMPDFADFVFKQVLSAATTSLYGPHLISLNPDFVDNFAEYISYLPIYVKCYPRWVKARAYTVRDKLLESYKRWHKHALQHSPLDDESEVLRNEYWGCRLMKDRYTYASKTSGMSADSIAAEDLGMLFASVNILFYTLLLRSNEALFVAPAPTRFLRLSGSAFTSTKMLNYSLESVATSPKQETHKPTTAQMAHLKWTLPYYAQVRCCSRCSQRLFVSIKLWP